MAYDIKFPEEKELMTKLVKRQLREIERAKNTDDLDGAIEPIVVLHQKITKYACHDEEEPLVTMYGLIASEDWKVIDLMGVE